MAMPDKTSEMLVAIAQNEKRIHDLGYQKGEQSGYESGYKSGYNTGSLEGYNSGYDIGSSEGYTSGHEAGYSEGYDRGNYEGFESGKRQQDIDFWEVFQQGGTRKNYEHGFAGKGWYKENMKPRYDITPSYASSMFLNCEYQGDLRDLPVKLDFSQSASMANLLGYAYGVTGIGTVDASKAGNVQSIFTFARALVTVEKLKLKDDGSQLFGDAFKECNSLQNIVIEGTIGQTVNFQWSKNLTRESIESIVYALSTETTGMKLTLPAEPVYKHFINDEIVSLFGARGNWTIATV